MILRNQKSTGAFRILGHFAVSAFAGIACGLIGGVVIAASALAAITFLGGP